MKKYSESFNKVFLFFFLLNRRDIITFCGSNTEVIYNRNGPSSKEAFKLYEDGFYKNRVIETKHPNILKSVLIGKKGWGLWAKEWACGVVDWTFTEEEILSIFSEKNVDIPKPFLLDFHNIVHRMKRNRNLILLKSLQ